MWRLLMINLAEIYTYMPAGPYSVRPGRLAPVMLNPTEREYEIVKNHPAAYNGFYSEKSVAGWVTMNDVGHGNVYIWPTYAYLRRQSLILPDCFSFVCGTFTVSRGKLEWFKPNVTARDLQWILKLPFFQMLAEKHEWQEIVYDA